MSARMKKPDPGVLQFFLTGKKTEIVLHTYRISDTSKKSASGSI